MNPKSELSIFQLMKTILVCALVGTTLTKINPKYKPTMIGALWRHGARTSKRDLWKIQDKQTFDKKELIGNGERMLYVLGRQLSQIEYPDLFKSTEPRKSLIYSSETERTILSAQSLAMGLYPPGKGPETTPQASSPEDHLKIQLPPWKGLDAALVPNNKAALPQRALPIAIRTQSPLYDDMFCKGLDHVCPAASKKSYKIA
jgi:hypothetical protein